MQGARSQYSLFYSHFHSSLMLCLVSHLIALYISLLVSYRNKTNRKKKRRIMSFQHGDVGSFYIKCFKIRGKRYYILSVQGRDWDSFSCEVLYIYGHVYIFAKCKPSGGFRRLLMLYSSCFLGRYLAATSQLSENLCELSHFLQSSLNILGHSHVSQNGVNVNQFFFKLMEYP